MTYKNFGRAFTLLAGLGLAACGGSTTINFVGDPASTGGEGGEGTGGNDGDGGGNLGGLGGDGSGGTGTGGGGVIILGYCGDGTISAADDEICDDGNERSGDGCSAACIVEPPFACFGEPSVCGTCGNGTHDSDEGCDDGNIVDGDGCSAGCAVEGTCEAPTVLNLEEVGISTSSVEIVSSTAGGGGDEPARVCSGLVLGAGSDRTFFVETNRAGDFTVVVESDFDAILRIYGSYQGSTCDPDREAFCIDETGAGDAERFHFRDMPAGAGVVISVDGAEMGEQGEFTLTVTQGCDIEHLKLHRLTPFYDNARTQMLSLKNASDYCAVDMGAAGLAVTDDHSAGPVEVSLPAQALEPGAVFRGSFDVIPETNPNAYDFAETPNFFDSAAAGAYVCDGPCDLDNGSNVTDAVLTGSGNIEIPGTTFLPAAVTGASGSDPYTSYVRVAYNGVAPDFLASDWSPAFLVDPDDYTIDWFDHYSEGSSTLGPLEFVQDPGEGAVVSASAPATAGSYSAYGADIPAAAGQPTYLSFKARVDTASVAGWACFASFGVNNSLGTPGGFGDSYDFSYAGRYFYEYIGGYGSYYYNDWRTSSGTFADGSTEWHLFEYENINWTNHTFDLRIDGAVFGLALGMNDATQTVVNLFAVRPWYGQTCQYSDIIVRNGPPGRIWESPPVLIAPD